MSHFGLVQITRPSLTRISSLRLRASDRLESIQVPCNSLPILHAHFVIIAFEHSRLFNFKLNSLSKVFLEVFSNIFSSGVKCNEATLSDSEAAAAKLVRVTLHANFSAIQ